MNGYDGKRSAAIIAGLVFLGTVSLGRAASADDPPQPTSNWGTMPNGWAGYSLSQPGGLLNMTPGQSGPVSPQNPSHGGHDGHHGHGHGHHGHGHHGHGHHGHGHHGHGHHGHGHHGVPHWGFYPYYPYGYSYFGGRYRYGISMTVRAPGFSTAPGAGGALPWLDRFRQERALAAREARPAAVEDRQDAADLAGGAAANEAAAEIRRRVAVLRESTPAGRERSDRMIAQADRYFADQAYGRALARYRQALAQAPDYPVALFRLGHAYVATGDYDLALNYFLMALEIAQSAERPGFSLEDLYRGNKLAKLSHINELADAALRQPDDGGLLMLVGMTLYYDAQEERARGFFERAAGMAGAHQAYVGLFLPPADVPDVQPRRFEG